MFVYRLRIDTSWRRHLDAEVNRILSEAPCVAAAKARAAAMVSTRKWGISPLLHAPGKFVTVEVVSSGGSAGE